MHNPAQKLYVNMKQLTSRIKEEDSNAPKNNKGDGLMIRKSMAINNTKSTEGMEENIKIANIMMMLEEKRNGTT